MRRGWLRGMMLVVMMRMVWISGIVCWFVIRRWKRGRVDGEYLYWGFGC